MLKMTNFRPRYFKYNGFICSSTGIEMVTRDVAFYRSLAILFLAPFYTGCAASGAGKKGGGESYHAPLGISYRADFFGVSQHILLNKYQYQFVREEENPRLIYFETAWKSRSVYADEVDAGIREVQSRIRINATLATWDNTRSIFMLKIMLSMWAGTTWNLAR